MLRKIWIAIVDLPGNIAAHEVTNNASDRQQLANMAKPAKSVIATEEPTAVADRGYYRNEELRDCDEANITTQEKGKTLHRYWTSDCRQCPLKAQCPSGKERRMTRWEHEEVLDAAQISAGIFINQVFQK
jgi:transposase